MKRIYFYDTGSFMKNWVEWVAMTLGVPVYFLISEVTSNLFQAVVFALYLAALAGYAYYKYKQLHTGYSIKYGGDDFELKLADETLNSSFSWIEKIKVSDEILTIERKQGKVTEFNISGVAANDIDKLVTLLATKNNKTLKQKHENEIAQA